MSRSPKKKSRKRLTSTASFMNGEDSKRTPAQLSEEAPTDQDSGAYSGALAKIPANSRDSEVANIDSDLDAIVAAWPNLPPAIRAGMIALVRAAGGQDA